MSGKNILLRAKPGRLTVARLDMMRLTKRADLLLATADLVANLIGEAISMGLLIPLRLCSMNPRSPSTQPPGMSCWSIIPHCSPYRLDYQV